MKGIVFSCALLILFGCAKAVSTTSKTDGILHLSLSEDPLTLDPALITDVSSGALSAKIFDGLVCFDKGGAIQSCLAQDWTISEDARVYTFHLRDNVFFHHGRRLVAQDVRASFERILDPATVSPRRWVLEKILGASEFKGATISGRIQGIATPDKNTVVLTLEQPFAPFLNLLAMPNAAVIPIEEVSRWGKAFGQRPVGTGPFMLTKWERDKVLELSRNERYFAGPAHVQGVEYRIIPESWASLAEFSRGTLDWIAIPQSHMDEFLADPSLSSRLKSGVGLNTYYLGINCSRPPLDRPGVRRALTMAIDRQKIVQRLMRQRAIVAESPIPPVLGEDLGHLEGIPFDPQGARKILQQEGVRELHLVLYQASNLDTLEIMEVVQRYLEAVGVRVEIVQREWSAFKEAVVQGQADMFFLSWWADYPDPENFLFPNFFSANAGAGGNKSRFSDRVFDGLILQANRETQPQQRRALYRQCVQRIVQQCPWILLWHRVDWVIVQPWVQGLEMGSVYNSDKFLDIRWKANASKGQR